MAGRRSPVTDIREIVRRLQLGEPDRRIARDLGVGRNTVARYREWADKHALLELATRCLSQRPWSRYFPPPRRTTPPTNSRWSNRSASV